jgi:hypothetical protein
MKVVSMFWHGTCPGGTQGKEPVIADKTRATVLLSRYRRPKKLNTAITTTTSPTI